MTDLAHTIRLAQTAVQFQDATAQKLFGWFAPLSVDQVRALSRSSDYHAARRALLRTKEFAGISEKGFSELVYCGRRLHVWEAMQEEPRLRPVVSAKALAKVIRERLAGPKIVVKLDKGEMDQAEAEAIAALKKINTSSDRVQRVLREALKDEPATWHVVMLRSLNECLVEVNGLIEKRNLKGWAELPKGGFMKVMKAWQLLKLPAPR